MSKCWEAGARAVFSFWLRRSLMKGLRTGHKNKNKKNLTLRELGGSDVSSTKLPTGQQAASYPTPP